MDSFGFSIAILIALLIVFVVFGYLATRITRRYRWPEGGTVPASEAAIAELTAELKRTNGLLEDLIRRGGKPARDEADR